MTRYYFHGDISPAPQSEAECGLDTRWFYDDRLKQVLVDSPGTTHASSADLRRLRYQLRCKRYFLSGNNSRPDDAENVFIRDPHWGQPSTLPQRSGSQEYAEDRVRLSENHRLLASLHCADCGHGRLHHAGDKCLFEASEWAPGKPPVRSPP